MDNDEVISCLNDLIETCKDGEYGFRTLAEHAKTDSLRQVFQARAGDCQRGASELQACVARLGGKAETRSSVAGTAHRGWIDVKSALGGGDLSLLNECERGEDVALKSYRKAIQEPLPADIAELVRKQYEGAKRNHDQIRTLRDAEKAKG